MSGAKVLNRQVDGSTNYKRAAPIFHRGDHKMHVLIVATDYKHTGRPLSCVAAARGVEELSRQCGVQWLTSLYDDECTPERVLRAVEQTTSKCGPDDVYVLYFAGHGMDAKDAGAQADGAGSSFVLVDKNGLVSSSTLLPGGELCSAVLGGVRPETRVLFIVDTCHSSTPLDLQDGHWEDRQVVAVSGTQDPHLVEEDRGCIFTHALLLAIDKLSKVGRDNYSVGMLFNAALHENELIFRGKQDLAVQPAPRFSAAAMAWPLVPPQGYRAPLSRCCGPEGFRGDAARRTVSMTLLPHVRQEALNVPVSIEEYVSHVSGQSRYNMKLHRACSAGCATGGCAVQ